MLKLSVNVEATEKDRVCLLNYYSNDNNSVIFHISESLECITVGMQ